MLALKYIYPSGEFWGISLNPLTTKWASLFGKVYNNIDEVKETYDCILIKDTLKNMKEPSIFLKQLKELLTSDGYIIGEMPNISNIKNIYKVFKVY